MVQIMCTTRALGGVITRPPPTVSSFLAWEVSSLVLRLRKAVPIGPRPALPETCGCCGRRAKPRGRAWAGGSTKRRPGPRRTACSTPTTSFRWNSGTHSTARTAPPAPPRPRSRGSGSAPAAAGRGGGGGWGEGTETQKNVPNLTNLRWREPPKQNSWFGNPKNDAENR